MNLSSRSRARALLSAAAAAALAVPSLLPAAEPYMPAPVSVSSANYAQTSRGELLEAVNQDKRVNPAARTLTRLKNAQRYVIVAGETYPSDISFDDISRSLAAALEAKGYVNAMDEQKRVRDAENVDLVLRVTSGERLWREPTVRTEQLTWRDGLQSRPTGRSLASLGGDVTWDRRAGGNDDALGAAAANENRGSFAFGSTPGTPAGGTPLTAGSAISQSQARAGSTEYESTREFYLLVVDAFDYHELRQKGERTKRLWTTFVAAPRQPGQKFSDVLRTMLRVATPYFGETTTGLQMFNDARARVEIGTPKVVESDVSVPKR